MNASKLAVVAGTVLSFGTAYAQEPATVAPAAATPAAATGPAVMPQVITVVAVSGKAAARAGSGGATRQLKAGDTLNENDQVITPTKSVVQIRVGDAQVFTIDQLSRVIIREAIAKGMGGVEKDTTALEVPYGRVKFDITSTAIANEVQIAAPDATLAVKGTTGGIEVAAGQPTQAYGGVMNTGVFEVRYAGRTRATVTRRDRTDSKRPDVAMNERARRYVEAQDARAREGDESDLAQEYEQLVFSLFENLIREVGQDQPFDLFAFDESTGEFARGDVFGGDETFVIDVSNLNLNNGPGTGAALLHNGSGTTLLRVESGNGTRLLGLQLDSQNRPVGRFEEIATYSADGLITGLGTIGNQIFAVEDNGQTSRIVELPLPEGGQTSLSVVSTMNLNMRLDSGLAGVTADGLLVAFGRMPQTGLSNGDPGILGADAAILFLDPRNNYLAAAVSDVNGLFQLAPGTDVSEGTITDTQRVTGISTLLAPFFGQLVVLATRSTIDGVPNTAGFMILDLSPDPSSNRPLVFATGSLDSPVEGFAGEARGTPAAPMTLLPIVLPLDPSIDPLFGDLAFSLQAIGSGVVERIARAAIIDTARDGSACRNSSELGSEALLAALVVLRDRRAGMSQAIAAFRGALPEAHPCLGPDPFAFGRGSGPNPAGGVMGPLDPAALARQFATMRYEGAQVSNGQARSIAASMIIASAANPAACQASGELTGPRLNDAIAGNVGQPGGVLQAVHGFRNTLPPNHPCRTRP